ncbi:hypothetical protein [Brevibacillus sp. 179-C9.3 HS]|uniref:hypothetical protein n=1 Tax=unclassified Brevibacillus TaxID=2684853 RepID=UPI0039A11BA6
MSAKKLLEKLESYEQSAYDGGIGVDWLANIGEFFHSDLALHFTERAWIFERNA